MRGLPLMMSRTYNEGSTPPWTHTCSGIQIVFTRVDSAGAYLMIRVCVRGRWRPKRSVGPPGPLPLTAPFRPGDTSRTNMNMTWS